MSVKSALIGKAKNYTPVFIDSSIFIYLFEDSPRYSDLLKVFFDGLSGGLYSAVSSSITLSEVLTKPYEEKKEELVKKYMDIFYHLPHFSLVSPNHTIALEAAKIKAEYQFHLLDSFQLALALESGCKSFLTNDKRLAKYKYFKILYLESFV